MDFTARVLFIIFTLICALLYKVYHDISVPLPAFSVDVDAYWGPNDKANYKEDKSLHLYKISYPEEAINELHHKLDNVGKFHEPLETTAFEYGFNSKELTKLIKYWKDTYLKNWRERELYLNQFPHYKTQIQGLDIHYIHAKPISNVGVKVIPIILLHGWPGSVREFYELIPKLVSKSDDKDFVFEVIAPSLPGYGFSQGSSKPGFATLEIATVLRNLMLRLGHNKFFVHGGDWGSIIGSNMAAIFPDNVLGYHSNMCATMSPLSNLKAFISSFYPSMFVEKNYVDWMFPMGPKFKNLMIETGYMHLQATKPDTIGIALSHNPVGLAAYIIEKFSTWTNLNYRNLPDGGLYKYFTREALLDNIMIYYLTNSITTSVRLYSESFNTRVFALNIDRIQIKQPSGCARFKYELAHQSDWQLKEKYSNLIHSTYHEDGGHFAAMQLPNVMYKDIIQFMKKVKLLGM